MNISVYNLIKTLKLNYGSGVVKIQVLKRGCGVRCDLAEQVGLRADLQHKLMILNLPMVKLGT